MSLYTSTEEIQEGTDEELKAYIKEDLPHREEEV